MQSLSHFTSLEISLDKHLYQLSTTSSAMRIYNKAPMLLKKAVTAVFKNSRTDTLRTKVLILASLRHKMAMIRAISHRIHALVSSDGREKQARLEYGGKAALALREGEATTVGIREAAAVVVVGHEHDDVIDLSEVAMFGEDDDHGYPDWTHSLFDDDGGYSNNEGHDDNNDHGDRGVLGGDALDEPSVLDIIRSNREVEGLEFNMDDEIDRACDMFIMRFRKRMNKSF